MKLKDILYFDSTRTNTLAVLNSLNNIKHWVRDENNDIEKVIPIKFGNYEKSLALQDIKNEDLNSGNLNFIPRLVLSFVGMSKNPDRMTNKSNKISKRVTNDLGKVNLNFGYNSIPYDFQYTLILQARGMNEAATIVEQILPKFRPSYPISIQEYPLFDDMTETQLQISDPSFEIMEEFEDTDINIINVTFDLSLRGNFYMPLSLQQPIEVVNVLNQLWDTQNYKDSQLASHYHYDVCTNTSKVYNDWNDHFAPPKLIIEDVTELTRENCNDPKYLTQISINNDNIENTITVITIDDQTIITEELR